MQRLIGLLVGVFLCADVASAAEYDDILFAPKAYFDSGKDADVVAFSGTLSGEGVGYKNNSYAFTCVRESKECWVSMIEQIGPNQIGRPDNPYRIEVTNWSESEIVAGYDALCARITVTVSRKAQGILWVQEPTNQSKAYCAKSDTKLYKWTIENPPGVKRQQK